MQRVMLFLIFIALPMTSFAQTDYQSILISSDFDASGLILLQHGPGGSQFLVVHDSKRPGQPRVGIISVTPQHKLSYRSLPWPKGAEEPIDVENLSRYPGEEDGFILGTSKGLCVHFKLSKTKDSIAIVSEFFLPLGLKLNSEIEGFSLLKRNGAFYAVWGDRGKDNKPAELCWGRYDPSTRKITKSGSESILVPWPAISEVRHLTELRVLGDGNLYLTSASEGSNDGPFAGALYRAGQFTLNSSNQLVFQPESNLAPLVRFEGNKVEGFDISGDDVSGAAFASDDENFGSTLLLNW